MNEKEEFLKMQDKVDILILSAPEGIKGWDYSEAEKFALENAKIPSGTEAITIMRSSLFGLYKVPYEHGAYAAKTALRIFDGESPSEIPVAMNRKTTFMINLKIAEKLGIIFTPNMLKNASLIIEEESWLESED